MKGDETLPIGTTPAGRLGKRVPACDVPAARIFDSTRMRIPRWIFPMTGERQPERRSRRQIHCPPEWVSADATFFITINCKERGKNQLAHDEIAHGLFEAIVFYHAARRWHVDLAMIMPDHLHALISFKWDPGNGMMSLIRNWKRYTARHLGLIWQRDYFDHRIRSDSDLQSTWYYIRENPVRA